MTSWKDLFPSVSAARGGVVYGGDANRAANPGAWAVEPPAVSTAGTQSVYHTPDDPTLSGAKMDEGDLWFDTTSADTSVWSGGGWKRLAPAVPGAVTAPWPPTVATDSANPPARRKVPATEEDGSTRLGPHWADKTGDGGWACRRCGFESMDAGVLAETECEE